MDSLAVPGVFRNSKSAKADVEMQREVRAHFDAHPGVRFLVDVLAALHARPDPVRSAAVFYKRFPASVTMEALEHRADLRARVLQALTAGPPSLTRRMAPQVITAQIELLVDRDIPGDERAIRAEEDRALSVHELYLKYLDPVDLAAYLPAVELWAYEMQGSWWEKGTDATRRLMAAEIKSIRRHKILTDTELIDAVGDEILERDLPLAVRTSIRVATRRAARENKPFSDTDLFDCVRTPDGTRDLVDSLAESVPLIVLRNLVVRAAQVLELEPKPVPPPPPPVPETAVTQSAEPSLMESLAPPSIPPKPRDAENDVS